MKPPEKRIRKPIDEPVGKGSERRGEHLHARQLPEKRIRKPIDEPSSQCLTESSYAGIRSEHGGVRRHELPPVGSSLALQQLPHVAVRVAEPPSGCEAPMEQYGHCPA